MPKNFIQLCLLAALAAALAAPWDPACAATLRLACSGLGQELSLCRTEAADWARQTGNTVELVPVPGDGTQRLAYFQKLAASASPEADILQIDVAAVGLLAAHLLDLRPFSHGVEKEDFPSIVANSTVRGELVAMPWFIDGGLLYYRRDLLERHHQPVPRTWDDLRQVAQAVQAGERGRNPRLWGYVWQGRAYEGLTCNGLEMMASFGAGTIVDAQGHVTLDNPQTVQAFATMAGFVGTISPPAVLDFAEDESLAQFKAGNAVFMRNWPYAWAATQGQDSPLLGKVGIVSLPAGGGPNARNAAALGGQELGVLKTSPHAALAADLVLYMTGADVQTRRAIKASYNPAMRSVYLDARLLIANPYSSSLQEIFAHAVARPTTVTGLKYERLSADFDKALHDVLAHVVAPDVAVRQLAGQLKALAPDGRW